MRFLGGFSVTDGFCWCLEDDDASLVLDLGKEIDASHVKRAFCARGVLRPSSQLSSRYFALEL